MVLSHTGRSFWIKSENNLHELCSDRCVVILIMVARDLNSRRRYIRRSVRILLLILINLSCVFCIK